MAKTLKILFLTVLSGVAFHLSSHAYAQTIAPQTCDTQVWQTMENRARLETEREIMQNQNLIFKADSVLTYTCFDSFAAHVSRYVGVLFTHTTYWDGKEIIPWGGAFGMDSAIQSVVVDSMNPYITGNFNHNMLGGRGDSLGMTRPTIQPIGSKGRTYSCSQMDTVWRVAKCMNFMQTADFAKNDGFYPFKNLAAGPAGGQPVDGYEAKTDVRQYPNPCSSGNPVTGGWAEMTNFSRNSANGTTYDRYYQYGTPNNESFTAVRTRIDPVGGTGGAATCGPAIKTGVKILLSPGAASTGDDGVCTNPGCTYTKGGTCTATSTAGGTT